jgi:uncharacterized damage-inducible protein DinB
LIPRPEDRTTLPPPEEGEYARFARGYVEAARAAGVDPRELMRGQAARLRAACEGLSEEDAARGYARGKWSVKEVLGHMADAERIFAYRLLRIARGDATPLPGFEQDDYVRAARYDRLPLDFLLADFEAARASTLSLIDGLEREALERRGISNGEPVSARALVFILAGHAEHHLRVLGEKYGLG